MAVRFMVLVFEMLIELPKSVDEIRCNPIRAEVFLMISTRGGVSCPINGTYAHIYEQENNCLNLA